MGKEILLTPQEVKKELSKDKVSEGDKKYYIQKMNSIFMESHIKDSKLRNSKFEEGKTSVSKSEEGIAYDAKNLFNKSLLGFFSHTIKNYLKQLPIALVFSFALLVLGIWLIISGGRSDQYNSLRIIWLFSSSVPIMIWFTMFITPNLIYKTRESNLIKRFKIEGLNKLQILLFFITLQLIIIFSLQVILSIGFAPLLSFEREVDNGDGMVLTGDHNTINLENINLIKYFIGLAIIDVCFSLISVVMGFKSKTFQVLISISVSSILLTLLTILLIPIMNYSIDQIFKQYRSMAPLMLIMWIFVFFNPIMFLSLPAVLWPVIEASSYLGESVAPIGVNINLLSMISIFISILTVVVSFVFYKKIISFKEIL